MILIIGGAYQGKLDYAKAEYGLTDDDVFTCEEGSTAIGFDEKIVDHFERYVLALIKAGQVPERAVGMQIRAGRYKGRIIICDDISQGLVPMDKTERAWREGVGRTMVKVAEQADKVIRVFCGLPVVLKDDEKTPKTDGLDAVFSSEQNGAVKPAQNEETSKAPAEKKPVGNPRFSQGRQAAQAFNAGGQGSLFSQAVEAKKEETATQNAQPKKPAMLGSLLGQVGLPHLEPGENGADDGLTPEEQFRKLFEQMKKDRAAAKAKAKAEAEAGEKKADKEAEKGDKE